jgi:methionyl-tRNA formyltransferase
MKILFFGSSQFSLPPLVSIFKDVIAVVTKRPRPKGRGYLLEDNEVKKVAIEHNIPLIEIDSFRDEAAAHIREIKSDLFVVASFGLIIPKWALDVPSIGAINIHPSLLPRYRGPSPIQWAILNGEEVTGITIMKVSERMDAGNIIYQEPLMIRPEDNAITLSERLSRRSAEILPEIINEIEIDGLPPGIEQNEEGATYTPIIKKEMGKIDWYRDAIEIARQIKAFVQWPTAYTFLDGTMLKIFEGEPAGLDLKAQPGMIVSVKREGIVVATSDKAILLKEVQLQNKRRMKAYDFANGYKGLIGKVCL